MNKKEREAYEAFENSLYWKVYKVYFKFKYALVIKPMLLWNDYVCRTAKPKFKKGDYAMFRLEGSGKKHGHYAIVIYEVMQVVKTKAGIYYKLKGRKTIKSDISNPYSSEAINYDPFCYYFDATAELVTKQGFNKGDFIK